MCSMPPNDDTWATMPVSAVHIELFPSGPREWKWRIVTESGVVLATSQPGYADQATASSTAHKLIEAMKHTIVLVVPEDEGGIPLFPPAPRLEVRRASLISFIRAGCGPDADAIHALRMGIEHYDLEVIEAAALLGVRVAVLETLLDDPAGRISDTEASDLSAIIGIPAVRWLRAGER
jgi:hypothetical protein